MKYSYNWLKDYISGAVPEPKKLAELLMGRSFEIDSVEKFAGDWVLDIKVLSNRAADCLSHLGIAREIAVILPRKIKLPPLAAISKNKNKKNQAIKVKIENFQDCPRYTALVIRGVRVGASPQWLKLRLEACGLQSINNIVDITNYVMLETGQSLHAFDLDKLGQGIIVRRARKGEFIKTLDKEKAVIGLDEGVLVIADDEKPYAETSKKFQPGRPAKGGDRPIAIAGIKGGAETGINENTKNIVIEAANFNPVLIRRASQKLKIRTDASWRFENGLDLRLTDLAQARVAYLINKMAKGRTELFIDVSVALPKAKQIRLVFSYLDSLLGVKISPIAAMKILKSLGCRLLKSNKQGALIEAPSQRLDLKTAEDLIEEVGRVWGYEKLPKTFPSVVISAPEFNKDWLAENKVKDILSSLGFCEAYNYTFIGEKDKEIFGYQDGELLEIANPISELNRYLRPSLAPHLLKNVRENLKNFSEVKIFEMGKVFSLTKESLSLGLIAGRKIKAGDLFLETKGAVEAFFERLGVSNFSFEVLAGSSYIYQTAKATEIIIAGKRAGFLGEVNKMLLDKLAIKENVILAEVDFSGIAKILAPAMVFRPISVYPASLRDIALLVPQEAEAADVLEKIKMAGGKILIEVELFDIYSGSGLPQGKKNMAFHLVYQSNEKTLSAEEVNAVHQKIFEAVERAGWEVRK